MRFFPALLVLVLPAFAAARGQSSTASPAFQPASPPAIAATPAMATYRDAALHLSYSYPAEFVDASAIVGPALQASLSDDPTSAAAARCISLPFSRMAASPASAAAAKAVPTPPGIRIIALVHADAACLKKKFTAKSLPEFAQGEAEGLSAAGAKTSFSQPTAFEVAAHPATLLQGSFTLPAGQPLHVLVACVLDAPDVVCWQFLASFAADLNSMAAFPVTFDGSPTAPLVSPQLLMRPQ